MQGLNLRLPPCEGVEAADEKTLPAAGDTCGSGPALGAKGSPAERPGLAEEEIGTAGGAPERSGFVYFIQACSGGPVKVGFATDMDRRLSELQVGSPVRLWALAKIPGTRADEREIHRRLAPSASHGEWFWPSDELEALLVEKVGRVPSKYVRRRNSRPGTPPTVGAYMRTEVCIACYRGPEDGARRLVCGFCIDCAQRLVRCHEAEEHGARIWEEMRAESVRLNEEKKRRRLEAEALIFEKWAPKAKEPPERRVIAGRACPDCAKEFRGSAYLHRKRCTARAAASA